MEIRRARDIAAVLELDRWLEAPPTPTDEACEAYLLDRPLSVEPVVRPILGAAGVAPPAREDVLRPLRLFRGAVRGLDDLLDASPTEPSGRPTAWARFGEAAAVRASLRLWERSLAAAPTRAAREAIRLESGRMLAAASLEEATRLEARSAAVDAAALDRLERRIRDKERAYWRLVAGVLAPAWGGSRRGWDGLVRLLVALADVWQRLDDARDLDEDLPAGRLSSFAVDLLTRPPGPLPASGPWAVRLEALLAAAPEAVAARREATLAGLRAEEERLRRAVRTACGGAGPAVSGPVVRG